MARPTSEIMTRIHQLENKYQQGLHRSDLVNHDEATRRLALKALALRDTNATLENIASEKEFQILSLRVNMETLKTELSVARNREQLQLHELQEQRGEIQSLKIDLENSNSSVERSNDAEQKNAALARELNNLRPECERLKSQLASHQAVVASNGDLRRQLNTLEVDLENEKRSKLRAHQAEENSAILDLRSRLQQVEGRLDVEKEEKNSLHRELTESRGQQKLQKERLNSIKSKLKETEAVLKAAQADLEKCQLKLATSKQKSTKPAEVPLEAKQVRTAIGPSAAEVEMSLDDVDIQTPGNGTPSETRQPRRRGTDHAPLGEKSNFSITPFLNKGRDASEYPELDSDKSVSNVEIGSTPEIPRVRKAKASRESPPSRTKRAAAGRRQPNKLNAKKPTEGNTQPRKAKLRESNQMPKSASRKRPRLGVVSDAGWANDDKENSDSDFASQGPETEHNLPAPEEDAPPKAQGEQDGQKRKRKLLSGKAKTMFDDDEMEDADNPLKLGPTKRSRAQLGSVSNAFAASGKTFSPLKRERRGVNASFLG